MDTIIDIIIRLTALLLCYGVYVLVDKAGVYIKEKAESEKLDRFVDCLVQAAEQMLRNDDPTGGKRLAYVQQQLIEAGYELTDALRALIESKVYKINVEGGAGK